MTCTRPAAFLLGILLATSARADLTVRWNSEFKFAEGLPPQITEAAKAQASLKPGPVILQYQGDRSSMQQGAMRVITDYARGTVTLLHPDSKRVATGPISAYPPKIDAFAKMPPEAREMLQNVKFEISTSKPGRTETIREIKTEEYEIRMSITIPTPAAAFEMKFVMSNFVPLASEVERLPALKQGAALMARAKDTMSPAAMMSKAFASFPGAGDKFKAAFTELMQSASNITVRLKMTMSMPGLVPVFEQMKKNGVEIPDQFDGTLGFFTMDLAQLDENPVPASAFAVPADYQSVSMEELFKVMTEQKAAAQ